MLILLISPDFFSLVELTLDSPSILSLADKLKNITLLSPALPAIGLALVNFYLSPLSFQLLSKLSNKQQIHKLSETIAAIRAVESREDDYFIAKELEIRSTWHAEMEIAHHAIKRRAKFCDFLISSTFFCALLTYVNEQPAAPCYFLAFICVVHCIGESRKNLRDYLAHIAIYRIANRKLRLLKNHD